MKELIDKAAVVAEIEKVLDEPTPSRDPQCPWEDGYCCGLYKAECIIDTLEVKNELEKFKKLPHINGLYQIVNDWGYTPNLYHFDGSWHVTWIHCEDGDGLDDFEGNTPEEAINKAYEWFQCKFNNEKGNG